MILESSSTDSLGRTRIKRLHGLHCQQCGNLYFKIKALLATSKFCSLACKGKSLEAPVLTACKTCGTEIRTTKSEGKQWCNRKCQSEYRPLKTCEACYKTFKPYHSAQVGRFCSAACKNLSFRGPFNPNYKGAEKVKYGYDWVLLRKQTLIRDNYTCQRCGGTDKKLHVHHKIPYRICRSHKPDNLQTLCLSCHKQVEVGLPFAMRPTC